MVPQTSLGVRCSVSVSPLPHVVRAVEGLLQWQVEQGLVPPQVAAGPRAAAAAAGSARGSAAAPPLQLRFDPSIGKRGAFYFADPGEDEAGLVQEDARQRERRQQGGALPMAAPASDDYLSLESLSSGATSTQYSETEKVIDYMEANDLDSPSVPRC